MATTIPIGSVIACGSNSPPPGTWFPCDGTELDSTDTRFAELFKAIGTTFGGDGNHTFKVPSLGGRFIRGAGGKAALGTEGAHATGMPHNNFIAKIPNLPTGTHKGNYGSLIGSYISSSNNSIDVTVSGGDQESRPLNAYVLYYIKHREAAQPGPGGIPAGGIVPLAGPTGKNSPTNYLLCDGQLVSTDDYDDLYSAISTNFGGDLKQGLIACPDFRGYFLRGGGATRNVDPEVALRGSPRCDLPNPGNMSSGTGSIQSDATGPPQNAFTATVPRVPTGYDTVDHIAGRDAAWWNDGSNSGQLASSGGDTETRPSNVYVDWYIRSDKPSQSDPGDFPIGGVIAYAGNSDPGSQWLLCDGRSLDVTSYKNLFDVIGTVNGGNGTNFNIPDYRDLFLRGRDNGAGRDPDAPTRTAAKSQGATGDNVGSYQLWATSAPADGFSTNLPHLPMSERDIAATAVGHDSAAWNSGYDSPTISLKGGDPETLPKSLALAYYIYIG